MPGTIDRAALLARCREYKARTQTLEAENADLKAALEQFGVVDEEDAANEQMD